MTYAVDNSPHKSHALHFGSGIIKDRLKPGATFMAHSVFEAGGFAHTSFSDGIPPDLQLFPLPWSYPPFPDESVRLSPATRPSLPVFSPLTTPPSPGPLPLPPTTPLAAP